MTVILGDYIQYTKGLLMNAYDMEQENTYIRLKNKIVIVINGKGGAGKDTVCDITSRFFKVRNISAITPIKEIAAEFGWNGEKDNKSRKFLSDLKRAFSEYNDLPNRYLEKEYHAFKESDADILFVHIREKDQIDAFKRRVDIKCVTMLVQSTRIDNGNKQYGNASDDNVEEYCYDYCYKNEKPIEKLTEDFMNFIYRLFLKEDVIVHLGASENLPWNI